MKHFLPAMILISFMLWCLNADAQTTNYRLKIEEGYVKEGSTFVKIDSTYFNYPNATAGDAWGNDFSEMYSFSRDSANQPITKSAYKSVFEWDANMRELSRTYYYWDNNSWTFDIKWENTYNGQGHLVKVSRYVQVLNVLQENYRITQTFNASGFSTERLEQEVAGVNVTNKFKRIYGRDASGNMTDFIQQSWSNNAWANTNRTTTSYKYGTTLADTVTRFDWTNNAWRTLGRDINDYNINGLQTQKITQTYNLNNQVFTNYRRETKSYNSSGKLITYGFYGWLNGGWLLDREVTYQTYTGDFFGRATAKEYNSTTSQLENISRTDNIFNTDGWRVRSKDYMWENSSWVETANRDFTFEAKQTSAINSIQNNGSIQAYPNPFTTNVLIEFDVIQSGETTIEIYNTTGQKIKQFKVNTPSGTNNLLWQGDDMNGNSAQAGIYLVRIQNGISLQFTKLIKQ